MNGHPHIGTATIIAFPAGGRASLARSSAVSRFKVDNANVAPVRIDYDAWYHQAAVADDKNGKDA